MVVVGVGEGQEELRGEKRHSCRSINGLCFFLVALAHTNYDSQLDLVYILKR